MISVEEALAILARESRASAPAEVDLGHARGCVLSETIVADRDFPPTDRSAMDGFAVRASDVRPGVTLEVAGELRAGQPLAGARLGPKQAIRIMTGAVVPAGADAVVMVERTAEDRAAGRVTIDDEPRPGQHIRRRGEELRGGNEVLSAGTPIRSAEIAALASVGRARVRVHRRPVVSVLTTGDEIVEPGERVEDHQVRNSNGHTLCAQLAEMGLDARDLGIVGDARGDLDRRLVEGLASDVLLISGGVSAGEYDLVGAALADAGMRLLFHKVAVQPGKPLLAGRTDRCLVLGLPGNPVSAYTCFAIFVAPALRRMMGDPHWENVEIPARLDGELRANARRATYRLATLERKDGTVVAKPVRAAGSGDVLSLSRSDGFIVTPAGERSLRTGESVTFVAWPAATRR